MQSPEYKQLNGISQSAIKAFKTKPIQKYKQIYVDRIEDEDDDTEKYAFGSLVDTLSFQPHLLDKRFYISDRDIKIPGDKVRDIVDRVYKEASTIVANKTLLNESGNLPEPLDIPSMFHLDAWNDLVFKYAKEINYGGSSWNKNRILTTAYSEGHQYFSLLNSVNGRIVISAFDNADAIETVEALKASKDASPYFIEQPGETLLFQQEISVEYQIDSKTSVFLKGALDIIRFIHTEQTVRVPDLKTTHNSDGFAKVAKSFDYVVQASFYNFLVREWLKTYEGGKYNHYKIEVPINIVVDRAYKVPYIYEYDWEDIEIAKEGSKELGITGWMEILKDIAWHMETGIWTMPREMYENGKIKLKIFSK
jgi:hypothetical protein